MSMRTTTTAIDALSEDRHCFEGIKDNDGGSSILMMGLVDWR